MVIDVGSVCQKKTSFFIYNSLIKNLLSKLNSLTVILLLTLLNKKINFKFKVVQNEKILTENKNKIEIMMIVEIVLL